MPHVSNLCETENGKRKRRVGARGTGPAPRVSRERSGFTPLALLVAMLIAATIAVVALPELATARSRAHATAMKADLRRLVAAEQRFFRDSSYYASAPTLVRRQGFRSSPDVDLPVVVTGARSWSATVSSAQLPGARCGIAVHAVNPVIGAARDGEPVCYVP